MTIRHHASDETLMRYAAGQLPAAPARVVAVHLATCPACRERLVAFEAVGGALLEAMEPVPLAPDAFASALRAIEDEETARHAPVARHAIGRPRAPATLPGGIALPAPLRDCEIGPWRWIGLGVRASALKLPEDPDARLTLLRVGAGRKLPEHGHVGTEFTQVIAGSFSDSFGRYGPGDLSEMDHEIEHQPIVDLEGECICLAALEGNMKLTGLFGRLVQPFVRL
ncbi:ChrR family anti-sigma-E factor [Ancylobacter dichloromethanicus]|uniref:Anti-sigma-E factor ChrR n=1 Tax=Ancylobacter dichloromethanicus TaxID=518825 RepID=A0A9W6J8P4_9HYPH|nr:ChrR family anti-sigma-E factor [Ancylobacter dichloromethanicus]MBS7553153.1 ChrR family anti-sigma-E factor [Ancylobacter dichloromethanicus]GLK72930.1 anti-sigma-E factor ChrR [Ancylobacter dichloromethanicus]